MLMFKREDVVGQITGTTSPSPVLVCLCISRSCVSGEGRLDNICTSDNDFRQVLALHSFSTRKTGNPVRQSLPGLLLVATGWGIVAM